MTHSPPRSRPPHARGCGSSSSAARGAPALLAALLAAGCGGEAAAGGTFDGGRGPAVGARGTVDGGGEPGGAGGGARALPQRIVALTCNATDIVTLLGELDRVVAVEEDCPAPGTEDKFKIRNDDHAGKAKALNVEAVLALHPDLVIAKASLRDVLSPLGVPMLWSPKRMDMASMPGFVRAIGAALGVGARAEEVLAAMERRRDQLRRLTAGAPRVRVYYEATGLGRSAGRRSVMHEMIELAGGANVAADIDRPGVVLTNEAILAADPEVIVLSPFADPTERILARPGWDRTTAVRTGRVHRIPLDRRYVLLATPRCVDGCREFLLPWIHPELAAAGAAEDR